VVKPNLCDALPVDLLNFAADNPSFPQQTTGDQFFDEAQWESYYQLGRLLADGLTPAFIEWLVGDGIKCFETDCGALADKPAAGKGASPPRPCGVCPPTCATTRSERRSAWAAC
jgi:hypothetical protein